MAVDGAANTVGAMKRGLPWLGALAVLGLAGFFFVREWKGGGAPTKPTSGEKTVSPGGGAKTDGGGGAKAGGAARGIATKTKAGLPADKAARLEKIRRDYDEIRAKMSADFTAAGDKFPGGLNAFLKQLALLEREMHADFAAALTPLELEDYEMSESTTGKALENRLSGATVSDEQRRAVYRLQKAFDDRFSLVFDVSPAALLERTKVQQAMREQIRATLGDEAFATWLRIEDGSYAAMRTMAREQGLPATAVAELWRIKNEWTQQKLEIAAQAGLTVEQRQAIHVSLVEQTRARVTSLLGPEALSAGTEALQWLPPGR